MNSSDYIKIEKIRNKADKDFRKGIELYQQGCDAPKANTPARCGWEAAREMAEVKSRWLSQARDLVEAEVRAVVGQSEEKSY